MTMRASESLWKPIHTRVCATAAAHGEQVAVDCQTRRITYRELDQRSEAIAQLLIASGAVKNSVVAVLCEHPIEMIAALLGVWKAGAVFVPLSPQFPQSRLAALLKEVPPGWFVVEKGFVDTIHDWCQTHPLCKVVILDAKGDPAQLRPPDGSPHFPVRGGGTWNPDDMCYVYFTSGSTGEPKGIAGRMRGIDHFIDWEIEALAVAQGARVSQLSAPIFDAFLRDVFLPLSMAGTVCAPSDRLILNDASRLVAWLHDQRIEVIHCVPSVFRIILSQPLSSELFPALRFILMAGEVLPPSDVKRWMNIFNDRIGLVNLYGQSETTMAKFAHFIGRTDADRRSIPIGRPIPGARAFLLDRRGSPCEPGTVGEIYISTPYCALGYYGRPDLTDEAFVRLSVSDSPNTIAYRTGDMGRCSEDGVFEFLGRQDLQVKVRAIRVELGEVEEHLRSHEAVRDVVVVAREDDAGNAYLCAYVIVDDQFDVLKLREYLLGRLPEYMVPSFFVRTDSFPRTPTGKVDRRAFPAPPPDAKRAGKIDLPRTPVEEILAGIWAQSLRLDRVGIHDDFFQLGGHSLLATSVISRIRVALHVDLPLRCLFESPTVAGLARVVSGMERNAKPSPITHRVARHGPIPLSYSQQRLWFLHKLAPDTSSYNLSAALTITGLFDTLAAEKALNEIVRRHETLRTRFADDSGGKGCQVIESERYQYLPVVDLATLRPPHQNAYVRHVARQEATRPFDLCRGPVFRATILTLSAERCVMLFAIHHIAADGWSIGLLTQEFSILYASFKFGRTAPLPQLSFQYADFSVWQRERLQSGVLEPDLDYWKQQLADLPEMKLPCDRARPAAKSWRGAVEPVLISGAVTRRLLSLGQQQGATLFMVLAAALSILLRHYTGQLDVVIGTPVANRTNPEIETLIGYFGNMLVLRIDLSDNPTFNDLLVRVRNVTLDGHSHQELPLEKVVELLQPERNLSHNPLFQVVLTVQNAHSETVELPDVSVQIASYNEHSAKFDWLLVIEHLEEGLGGYLEYNTDIFERRSIQGMFSRFEQLLSNIATSPLARVEQLEILDPEDKIALTSTTNIPELEDNFTL